MTERPTDERPAGEPTAGDRPPDDQTADGRPAGEPAWTRLLPEESEAGRPFWEAGRERRFVLPYAAGTDRPVWFPREVDPATLEPGLEWREAGGLGTVYAVTVEHRPQNPGLRAMAPYAVALVDLDAGVRLLTNVVGCPPEDVTVGMRVEVDWEPLPDGRNLPVFRPV